MMLLRENNKAPTADSNEMEICELSDKEFRIIFLNYLSKLQGRQPPKEN